MGGQNGEKKKDLQGNLMRTRSIETDIDTIYTFEKAIGHGSMGAVATIIKKSNKQVHVLKTIQISRMSQEFQKELRNEIEILMSLDHPNIIKPLELFVRKRQLYFVMEHCSGGDLYERMPYTEAQAANITNQITSAIRYLHSKAICHRDLKFENILFENKSENCMVKLIDFGLSKAYQPGRKMNEIVGTLYSMAPEVLNPKIPYTQSTDMWSVGVIAYMLLSGMMPFDSRSEAIVVRKIQRADFNFKAHVWKTCSDDSKLFIQELLKIDPSERLSASNAMSHQWLAKEWELTRQASLQLDKNGSVDGHAIVSSLKNFSEYSKLRKAALMVVAHRSESIEISKMRSAFMEIDTSKEGNITLDELKTVLSRFGSSTEEVEQIFMGLDVDGTGKIGYTEFLAATLEAQGFAKEDSLLEAFDRLDSDDSGFISEDNLRDILGSAYDPAEVKQMIADADLKKNGRVDYDEFLALMNGKRNKDIEKLTESLPTPVVAAEEKE